MHYSFTYKSHAILDSYEGVLIYISFTTLHHMMSRLIHPGN